MYKDYLRDNDLMDPERAQREDELEKMRNEKASNKE
jgi:hypothetical protein